MNTRVEIIKNHIYCAYCGAKLRDPQYLISPEPPLICSCEKAQEELKLYDQLKEMYNLPMADNLIDMKVEVYKSKLKGTYDEPHCGIGYLTGSIPISLTNAIDLDQVQAPCSITVKSDLIGGE